MRSTEYTIAVSVSHLKCSYVLSGKFIFRVYEAFKVMVTQVFENPREKWSRGYCYNYFVAWITHHFRELCLLIMSFG